ncbi:MAG TPA: peptidylprolyl isomerase [Candidatus Limnocylindrales bacterium]
MTSATIATTKGDIELELFTTDAPKAAGNFVKLARQGFYDGVIFHRVIPGFVVQGGDGQYGKLDRLDVGRVGTGGPGYTFEDEPIKADYGRGTLAMANAGRNTNGSQFFICLVDLAGRLPKNYTIFGQVTRGMDVVDAIAAGKTGANDRPVEPVAMESVTIHEEA